MKPVIITSRLYLNHIAPEYINDLLKIYSRPENMKYISSGKYDWTNEELVNKYNKLQEQNTLSVGVMAVMLKSNHKIIGEAGFFNSFGDKKHFEIGYILDNAHWSCGYGTEICQNLISYGFEKLHLCKITARMYADNVSSVRIAEKCNMIKTEEGLTPNGKTFFRFQISNPGKTD